MEFLAETPALDAAGAPIIVEGNRHMRGMTEAVLKPGLVRVTYSHFYYDAAGNFVAAEKRESCDISVARHPVQHAGQMSDLVPSTATMLAVIAQPDPQAAINAAEPDDDA